MHRGVDDSPSRPIRCPNCGEFVVRTNEGCPKCDFPLSRFESRMRWSWVLAAGLVASLSAAIMAFAGFHFAMYGWYAIATGVLAIGGIGATAAGIFGVIFGGRHTHGRHRTSSNWHSMG